MFTALPQLNPARWSWRALLIAGFVVYGIAAFGSEGWQQLDEHFQIIEFANYKLGGTPAADLPWEFPAQIRPTLQPVIAAAVLRSLRAFGVTNPFTQAFVLRLLVGWLAILVFAQLSRKAAGRFASDATGKVLFAAAIFLWYMPYVGVRFSSENLSALAFLAGVSLLPISAADEIASPVRNAVAGLLLGLSFVFRFQMGFALVGVAAWIIVRSKWRWSGVLALVAGGVVAVAIGTGVDTWFYGHFVFTPWRYFDANILQGKAAEFGVAPWWFYLQAFVQRAAIPISLALLILGAVGAYHMRTQLITWAFVAFVLGHLAVGHKEFRFLFPMAFPLLWLAVAGWERWRASGAWRRVGAGAWWTGLPINTLGLIGVCALPAEQFVPAWRFLFNATGATPSTLYAVRSPYEIPRLKPRFYEAPNLTVRTVPTLAALDGVQAGDLLLQRHMEAVPVVPGFRVVRVFRTFPDWLLRINFGGWEERTEIWSIYRVQINP